MLASFIDINDMPTRNSMSRSLKSKACMCRGWCCLDLLSACSTFWLVVSILTLRRLATEVLMLISAPLFKSYMKNMVVVCLHLGGMQWCENSTFEVDNLSHMAPSLGTQAFHLLQKLSSMGCGRSCVCLLVCIVHMTLLYRGQVDGDDYCAGCLSSWRLCA